MDCQRITNEEHILVSAILPYIVNEMYEALDAFPWHFTSKESMTCQDLRTWACLVVCKNIFCKER